MFENLQGTVENLKIKDANVQTWDGKDSNVLATETNNAKVSNVHFEKIYINGTNHTAIVSGKDIGSTFNNISLKGITVAARGQYSGTFIGEAINSNISNILILDGRIIIIDDRSGGFIGNVKKSTIDKVFVDVDSNFDNYYVNLSRARSAGFIGNIDTDVGAYSKITNSVSVGDVSNPEIYKFVGAYSYFTANSHGRNNFECKEATGKALNKDLAHGIERSALSTEDFYRNRVSFDESIWDLSTVVSKGHPTLKEMN